MRTLTKKEILACARGIRQAVETDRGLELRRFSDAELAYYRYSEAATQRALCMAGVALAFETDSDALAASLRLGGGARAYAFVDVYVDGLFVATGGAMEQRDRLDVACRWPARGTHRVTLYLPHCRQAGIVSLALADGASCIPLPARPVLLALGDSITQGMESPHPSLTWPAVAARALEMDLHNCGIGGHYFAAAGLPERPVDHPALITVAYGTNDWNMGRSPEEARPYLARVRALYPTAPLAVLEPIWWDGGETSEKHGLTFPAYRQALAAIIADAAVDSALPMAALLPPGPAFLADGVHPTAAGHVVLGLNIAEQLRPVARA
ncbi:MAG TPA: SGNH/GDSL hydrolase family protein [Armatimonadota bacterium]|nr:SGNH/GDSL hydrolase family protein [Armatimonadota bacterium]